MFGALWAGGSAWTPADLNPRGLWVAGNYFLNGSGIGQWPALVYNGLGTGVMGAASGPTSPTIAAGAAPSFAILAGQSLGLAGGNNIQQIVGNGKDATLATVIRIASITGTSTTSYLNNMVMGDTLAYAGLYLGRPGANNALIYWYDGTDRHAAIALGTAPISGLYTIVGRNVNGQLDITIDGVLYVTGDATGNIAGGAGFDMGAVAVGGLGLNATVECNAGDNRAWTNDEVTKFFAWSHRTFH